MAIVINGSGTVTGLAVGGLPDGTVDAGTLATNSVDSAELVDGAVDDSHMASIKGRRNILINGDFSVSQRGDYTSATTATHLQYYLDRFYVARDGVTGTIQDTGFAAKLVATSSATGTLRLVQPIEDTVWLGGKTVTLSCQMKSNDSNSRLGIYAGAWQSTTAAHTGGGAWETLSMTLTLPASIGAELSAHFGIDGASSANVSISSGAYCEMKDLQLEVGSTATDFEHRSYGEELALCQRYYQEPLVKTVTGKLNTNWQGRPLNIFSTTRAFFNVSLPVTLRALPTATVVNPSFDIAWNGSSRQITSQPNAMYPDCQAVGFDIDNGGTNFIVGYSAHVDIGSGCYVTLDAEL